MPSKKNLTKALKPETDIYSERKPFPEFQKIFSFYLDNADKKISLRDKMEATLQLAFCEAILTNTNEAEKLLSQCEEYIQANGKKQEKATIHHIKARIYLQHSNFEMALGESIKSLYLFKQLDFSFFTMNTSTCCGVICAKLNLFSEALDHMTRAHTIAMQMGDNKSAILATANLNDIRLSILPVEDCIYHNEELLGIIKHEYGDAPSTAGAGTFLQLSNLYLQSDKLADAESYADKSLEVLNQLPHLPPHHFLYTNLYTLKAEIAAHKEDEEAMKKNGNESTRRAKLIDKIAPEIDFLFTLFRFYLKKKDINTAKSYLDKASDMINSNNQSYQLPGLNENICLYYHTLDDSKSELHHFKLIHEWRMKTQQQALASRAKYMSTVYELEMLQKESEIQKKELDFKTQELNITTHYLQQRNELLSDLQNDINQLKKQKSTAEEIVKTINEKIKQAYAREESEKVRFKEKFDETQRGFISELHKQHPTLSNTECRISALLRSGFNTKEIAHLLSSSIRTIENHRANVRRKLNLGRDSNLNLILAEINN